MKKILYAVMALSVLVGCQAKTAKVAAIDPADFDLSVAPGENFYLYANGGWMKNHPLSPEYARYGAFDILGETNEIRLNQLFSSMTSMKVKDGTVEQKIVDLYKQGLDSLRLNAEGAAPLKPYLDRIFAIRSKPEFIEVLAECNKRGDGGLFSYYVSSDMTDSNSQILYVSQSGLGIGDRDYYLDPANAAIKDGYTGMLEKYFTLCGIDGARIKAENTVKVEDALAALCWDKARLRDVAAQYNPMSSQEFFAAYPGFDFPAFFEAVGVAPQEKMVVEQLSFFEGFSGYFQAEDLEVLKDYLAAQIVCGAAGFLSDDFQDTRFDFYSRQLSGIAEQKPRWKMAMYVPNSILSEAVGQMYVKEYFPESYKQRVLSIVRNLQESLGQHIDALDWMGDSTKAYAREKLANFTVKIGYPDKWKDYGTLDVDPQKSYYENICAAQEWYFDDQLSKLGKPTDRDEWFMSPQTVNAYYNPTTNEICFPAAILQPPFFNADADEAVNYGAIGVVIGHEMTHGFDDQGRLFDKDGNMNGWWTAEDSDAFNAKADKLVEQYGSIEVLPGIFANGRFSLGENIADQGGVGVSFTAMQNSWNGSKPADIDGFTAEQRFFLGFAHVWAGNITDEEIARRTKMDEHSLSINRVNATLKNFPEFFEAFGIKEGDPMFRPEEDRVMIW